MDKQEEQQRAEFYCGQCGEHIAIQCIQHPTLQKIGVYVVKQNEVDVGEFDPAPSSEIGQRIREHFFREFGLNVAGD